MNVPDVTDLDILSAALRYAESGWYVLPVKGKRPALGDKWHEQTSRDPQQIAAWFAGSNHGLALHVGRSGAVVFDVDMPGHIPLEIARAIVDTKPPYQATRKDSNLTGMLGLQRGHYVFRQPAGRTLGNGAGKFGRTWGEVRGLNGIIIVQPTPHTNPEGQYLWVRTGEVPELPAEIAAQLPDAQSGEDSASMEQVEAFIARYDTGDRTDLLNGLRTQYRAGIEGGHGRHTTALAVACEAAREARAGQYPAAQGFDVLREEFSRSVAGERSWQGEWRGILAWAVGQATVDATSTLSSENGLSATQSEQNGSGDTGTARKRRLRLTQASTVRPGRVRWGWSDRFPVGELTLIPGREGIGKSLFLSWMAAQLTKGTLPGEWLGNPRAVLYAASEDSWRYTIVPRMLAAGANLDLVYRVEIDHEDVGLTRLDLPLDCAAIPDAAQEVNAAALMLDPIVSHIDDALSVNQSRELRRALEPLRDTAEKAGIMVPALVHFSKVTDVDVLSKIPGARAWAEVARAAFGLASDEENGGYVASQLKNNLGRLDLPNLSYSIEGATIDTDDGPTSVGRLIWGEETTTAVADVLDKKQERGLSDRAMALLALLERAKGSVAIEVIYNHFPLINQGTIRQTLNRLKAKGMAATDGKGNWRVIEVSH